MTELILGEKVFFGKLLTHKKRGINVFFSKVPQMGEEVNQYRVVQSRLKKSEIVKCEIKLKESESYRHISGGIYLQNLEN